MSKCWFHKWEKVPLSTITSRSSIEIQIDHIPCKKCFKCGKFKYPRFYENKEFRFILQFSGSYRKNWMVPPEQIHFKVALPEQFVIVSVERKGIKPKAEKSEDIPADLYRIQVARHCSHKPQP